MKIAQIAPLYEAVPPKLYGGTERVVSWLTEELIRQGHDVTLFASGDSTTSARLAAMCPRALWSEAAACKETLPHHVLELERVMAAADKFDVLHFHTDFLHFPFTRRASRPSVTTLHGALNARDHGPLFSEYDDVPLISISDSQRRPVPDANWAATIHHGLPLDLHPLGGGGDYLAFLGRASPEKGLDRAIELAQRTQTKLKIAVRLYPEERVYYNEVIAPLLRAAAPYVEMVGEVGGAAKDAFLGNARALLFPIDWAEPFGLVMIEAMACGTPVVAFRNGSVPEVIDEGVTGFVVGDLDQAVLAIARTAAIDRRACRDAFVRRFGVARMARDYVDAYRAVIEEHDPRGRSGAVLRHRPRGRPGAPPGLGDTA